MGMDGEAGMRCFPRAKALAFSLLGSIRPSHILQAVRNQGTDEADAVSASNVNE